MDASHESLLQQSCAARDAFWSEWGDIDSDLLAPIINPALQGLPAWPALRQAYRVVRRGSLTLIATDGLSDPFDDPSQSEHQGFGLELFAVTKDPLPAALNRSWLLDLVYQVGLNAADHGGFRDLIDQQHLLSMQLFDGNRPPNPIPRAGGIDGMTLDGIRQPRALSVRATRPRRAG